MCLVETGSNPLSLNQLTRKNLHAEDLYNRPRSDDRDYQLRCATWQVFWLAQCVRTCRLALLAATLAYSMVVM